MFSGTGSSGLYKAPLSKSLMVILSTLAFILTVPLQQYQQYFIYNLQAIKQDHEIWRIISARTVCLDLKDLFCSCILIYNFRIFERRYGSRKFASFLLGSWVLSAVMDLLLVEALQHTLDVSVSILPSGFLGPIFALFVPFYFSIPSVQVTQILGRFSITNKTLVYIVGLQLLTSSTTIWILALSGLFSGIVYHYNVLKVQQLFSVPKWVTRCASFTLEPLFSSADPTHETPIGMGATLEIQRQQRMELLDQQLMLAQLNQNNRRRRWQGGLINWNRLFPPLRNRFPSNNQQQESEPNRPSTTAAVSEEQIPLPNSHSILNILHTQKLLFCSTSRQKDLP
ncbi:ubiquitin-associated domain-containing protein 2 isoform X2 [Carcharodon carcharias]|uniref:ubiquitin-associated domain-containing protein 2 isoform X2 n=1 Tax=Carcharodon carcharias TaxID=13397 RepID=UPI001B7DC35E|nr:ubiquitin-associated domain-containing protein 2 isoform X2 [Carcharodon carcharias]